MPGGRDYSCPPDRPHLWEALRYTELNPVRAKLVTEATSWTWSSAAAHCGPAQGDTSLSTELWQTHWTNTSWRKYLAEGETETESASIRQCTHTGRPLGTEEFVHELENAIKRRLVPQKGVDAQQGLGQMRGRQTFISAHHVSRRANV